MAVDSVVQVLSRTNIIGIIFQTLEYIHVIGHRSMACQVGGNKKGYGTNRTLFINMAGTTRLELATFALEMRDVLNQTELRLRPFN